MTKPSGEASREITAQLLAVNHAMERLPSEVVGFQLLPLRQAQVKIAEALALMEKVER